MKKLAVGLFYFIIAFCVAYGLYSILKSKGDYNLIILGLLVLFIALSCISLYFLKKKDDTFF